MIDRVISGGQTGADQAGLRAARKAGIPTGGYAPRGWLTEAGSAPWLADFGLVECPEPSWERPEGMPLWQWNSICYKARTKANACEAGTTLWFDFAGGLDSRGFHATWNSVPQGRNALGITKDSTGVSSTPQGLVDNFHGVLVGTVNVAGNRESKSRGIGEWVEEYLAELFALLADA